MPAERSETRRASSRKYYTEEETDLRRARGEISCAECRRLKLKCDKKVPCSTCVRRGCTTICPNGSLSTGQGTRFVLADTEQLHRKIAEMSERIRQLEDALAMFQSGVSDEPHPLLRDELLAVKFGPELSRSTDEESTREALSQSIDALGTLTIGDNGETKFIGRSGGSETFFMIDRFKLAVDAEVEEITSLPLDLTNLSQSFPFANIDDDHEMAIDKLKSYLPPQPRAWALCETYLAHFAVWCRPIKRDELIDDILIPIYNSIKDPSKAKKSDQPSASAARRRPHLLAVLFLILAVGALVDLTLPPCSAEAEMYHRLGRAALSVHTIFDSPDIETVQALVLMSGYQSLCGQRHTIESAWSLISLAAKLAQSIGLHRESRRWKLDEKIVQRRRNLFWETIRFEMTHCMALGRPPTIQLTQVDCELPFDDEQSVDANGEVRQGYWHCKMVLFRDVVSQIGEVALSAKPPSYAAILDLDRKIRQSELPSIKLYLKPDEDEFNNPALSMIKYYMSQYSPLAMIYIHRTYFAQTLLEKPTNPLSSPFAPSFLAANRSASTFLKTFAHHYEGSSELSSRFWNMWTHAFSAAMIRGATVARNPNSSMASSALADTELAVGIFERGAAQSFRARQGLPLLLKLKDKATKAYAEYRDKQIMPIGLYPKPGLDGLALFGGQTQVLQTKALSRKMQKVTTVNPKGCSEEANTLAPFSPRTTPTTTDGASPLQSNMETLNEVHPLLMEYLSQIPLSALATTAQSGSKTLDSEVSSTQPQLQTPMPESFPPGDMDFLQGLLADPQFNNAFSSSTPSNTQMTTDLLNAASYPADEDMNNQWMSLMQETGILDGYGNVQETDGESFFTQVL
ncbi:hypothetical protein AcV5_003545 [Taiwanofungus camphoratus]|nr:hypothetical protein AcV5_003545 [Antrodia cinnamomea]